MNTIGSLCVLLLSFCWCWHRRGCHQAWPEQQRAVELPLPIGGSSSSHLLLSVVVVIVVGPLSLRSLGFPFEFRPLAVVNTLPQRIVLRVKV